MNQINNTAGAGAGELIRRYRIAAGLSQEELSEKADISVRTVRNLEHGRVHRPRHSTLQLLAVALGLDDGTTARLTHMAWQPGAPPPPVAPPTVIVVTTPSAWAWLVVASCGLTPAGVGSPFGSPESANTDGGRGVAVDRGRAGDRYRAGSPLPARRPRRRRREPSSSKWISTADGG